METDRFYNIQEELRGFYKDRPSMNEYNKIPLVTELALAIEVAEMLEDSKLGRDISGELADVMLYVMTLSLNHGIDILNKVEGKLEQNKSRFPPENFQGTAQDFIDQYKQTKVNNGERFWPL